MITEGNKTIGTYVIPICTFSFFYQSLQQKSYIQQAFTSKVPSPIPHPHNLGNYITIKTKHSEIGVKFGSSTTSQSQKTL